ncbi:MAG: hypothetical protein K6C36_03435, partial [Clostridia bacterium]|nr:hypothetical protein [Clostridia bacterium]
MKEFFLEVCNIPNIVPPNLREVSELATATMIARFVPDDNALEVKTSASPLDKAFAIAHELRHVWQMQTDEARWFDEY